MVPSNPCRLMNKLFDEYCIRMLFLQPNKSIAIIIYFVYRNIYRERHFDVTVDSAGNPVKHPLKYLNPTSEVLPIGEVVNKLGRDQSPPWNCLLFVSGGG